MASSSQTKETSLCVDKAVIDVDTRSVLNTTIIFDNGMEFVSTSDVNASPPFGHDHM